MFLPSVCLHVEKQWKYLQGIRDCKISFNCSGLQSQKTKQRWCPAPLSLKVHLSENSSPLWAKSFTDHLIRQGSHPQIPKSFRPSGTRNLCKPKVGNHHVSGPSNRAKRANKSFHVACHFSNQNKENMHTHTHTHPPQHRCPTLSSSAFRPRSTNDNIKWRPSEAAEVLEKWETTSQKMVVTRAVNVIFRGKVGCTPTNVPLLEIPIKAVIQAVIVGIYGL